VAVKKTEPSLPTSHPFLSTSITTYLRCANTQLSRRPDTHRLVFAEPNHGRYLSSADLQQFLLDAGLSHRPRRDLQETRTGTFTLATGGRSFTDDILSRLQGVAENDEIVTFIRVR